MFPDDESYNDGKIRTFHKDSLEQESTYKPLKAPCYESHPALIIGGKEVYGGSCSHPMVTNADIYIGLDFTMARQQDFPWNEPTPVQHIYFPISDGTAPKDPAEFDKMIKWLAVQLAANKLIHIGCIGGHGRTGMVLAALVKEVDGIEDAITYVRKNYCKKAVEAATQVAFLNKHYGIKTVQPSRHAHPVLPAKTTAGRSAGSFLRDSAGAPFKSRADELNAQFKRDRENALMQRSPGIAHRAPVAPVPAVPLALRPSLPQGPIWVAPSDSLMSVWGAGAKPLVDKRSKSAKMQEPQEGANDGYHTKD